MIATDTSSFIAYLQGEESPDTQEIDEALKNHTLVFPPVVFSEILSDNALPIKLINKLNKLPVLPILDGYWYRVGRMRAKILSKKLKARLADTLIAQSCIDHQITLITRDNDYRHFVTYANLVLFKTI